MLTKFSEILKFGAVQRIANLVDLEKRCKMSILTQKSALIQPRGPGKAYNGFFYLLPSDISGGPVRWNFEELQRHENP